MDDDFEHQVLNQVGNWPAEMTEGEFDLGVIDALQRVRNRTSNEVRVRFAANSTGTRGRQLHWSIPDYEARNLRDLLNELYVGE